MVQIWLTMAQAQFFKWRRYNLNVCECGQNKKGHKKTKTCKKFKRRLEIKLLQLGVRPSIFGCYELIFPKEGLNDLLSMLGVGRPSMWDLVKGMKGVTLRKMFNCRKIPKKNLDECLKIPNEITLTDSERGLSNLQIPGVAHHIIGIKDDVIGECEEWGYKQEMV